jgi:hypothetical protein
MFFHITVFEAVKNMKMCILIPLSIYLCLSVSISLSPIARPLLSPTVSGLALPGGPSSARLGWAKGPTAMSLCLSLLISLSLPRSLCPTLYYTKFNLSSHTENLSKRLVSA